MQRKAARRAAGGAPDGAGAGENQRVTKDTPGRKFEEAARRLGDIPGAAGIARNYYGALGLPQGFGPRPGKVEVDEEPGYFPRTDPDALPNRISAHEEWENGRNKVHKAMCRVSCPSFHADRERPWWFLEHDGRALTDSGVAPRTAALPMADGFRDIAAYGTREEAVAAAEALTRPALPWGRTYDRIVVRRSFDRRRCRVSQGWDTVRGPLRFVITTIAAAIVVAVAAAVVASVRGGS